MRSRIHRSHGITHSLTPFLEQTLHPPSQYQVPLRKAHNYTPLYQQNTHYNPHQQRSRKHRLVQEKNTDIQRENRRLYEKLRKIKLKNAYQSEQKLSLDSVPQINFTSTIKPLSLPQVGHNYSMGSTRSQLNVILNDRKTFVNKYFDELSKTRGRAKKSEELGSFVCNRWKIRALLLDDEFIILHGRKGAKQLTKKYNWDRVKSKITNGLEQWVKIKYQFEE